MNIISKKITGIGFAILLLLSTCSTLFADPFLPDLYVNWKDKRPYKYPTDRFLGEIPYSKIKSTLESQNISLTQKPFYDIVKNSEERGFIGYHASGHTFRVFQDIIRMTLEEVLGLEFKKDFYFFRFPGDQFVNDHPSASHFLWKYRVVNDNLPEQRNQLISANFSLFNNYDQKYECSVVFFERSISFTPPNFEAKIQYFFNEMGMPSDQISQLFNIGKLIENPKAGTLFQIFDFSHQDPYNKNAYEFADKFLYPCIKKGVPIYTHLNLSDLYQASYYSQFLAQYRIVVNTGEFLNPYSSIAFKRYDLNDPKVIKNYEKQLRAAIKAISFDPVKAEQYKMKLMQYWHQN